MRFVLAISALVLSGVLLILGIGQVTFFAGPKQIVYSADLNDTDGIVVINAEQFDAVHGQANVTVTGNSPFIAMAKTRDIDAWVAPFPHVNIAADPEARELALSVVPQDSAAAEELAELRGVEVAELTRPSPRGSDLWLEERFAEPAAEESAEGETSDGDAAELVQSVRMPVALTPNQSLLIAVELPPAAAEEAVDTGETAEAVAPAEVSITWAQDRRTPWAGPLLVAGGFFALLGALLYLFAVDHDRRGLGPRRGRRGPLLGIRNVFGRRRKTSNSKNSNGRGSSGKAASVALPAIALTAALGLSGCSPSYWPDLAPEPEVEIEEVVPEVTNTAPVPVTQAQIDRILTDIATISGAADDALDPAGLESRFVGDALEERKANYTIRSAVSDYEVVVPRITDESLGYQLIQSTEGWPRTVFVVVASESTEAPTAAEEGAAEDASETDVADSEAAEDETAAEDVAEADDSTPQVEASAPSLALIMTQAGPHENFTVSRTIALRGGITMPEAAPAEEGTAILSDDQQSLAITPAEVGPAYAAVLAGGTEVEQAALFNLEGDSLIERSGAAWVAQSTEAAAAAEQGIQYSVSAEQSDTPIVSLSTGIGGALVATTVLETRVEEPQEDSRWRPTVPQSMEALSGLEGQQDMLVSTVAHQLLFYVPSVNSTDSIQLLGYTSDLISASNE